VIYAATFVMGILETTLLNNEEAASMDMKGNLFGEE
jgi:hypothetical protein